MPRDIVDILSDYAKPSVDLYNAAIEVQHVADKIKEAVGAPYRPAWCDPTITAKALANRDHTILFDAINEITRLRKLLANSQSGVFDALKRSD